MNLASGCSEKSSPKRKENLRKFCSSLIPLLLKLHSSDGDLNRLVALCRRGGISNIICLFSVPFCLPRAFVSDCPHCFDSISIASLFPFTTHFPFVISSLMMSTNSISGKDQIFSSFNWKNVMVNITFWFFPYFRLFYSVIITENFYLLSLVFIG